jgi:hypothetical protein
MKIIRKVLILIIIYCRITNSVFCQETELVLSDDFSSDTKNWSISYGSGYFNYISKEKGLFYIKNLSLEEHIVFCNREVNFDEDFHIKAEIKRENGFKNGYGIVWAARDNENCSYLTVESSNIIIINRHQGMDKKIINLKIPSDCDSCSFSIISINRTMSIYINEKNITTFSQISNYGNKFGFICKNSQTIIVKSVSVSEIKYPKVELNRVVLNDSKSGNNNLEAEPGETVDVDVELVNFSEVLAENVKIAIINENNSELTYKLKFGNIGDFPENAIKVVSLYITISREYKMDNIPVKLSYSDEIGTKKIFDFNIKINDFTFYSKNLVDNDIPESDYRNPHRYALIFGNEDYKRYQRGLTEEQNVDFARLDAYIFKQYALKIFGIPEKNIIFKFDAKKHEMENAINQLIIKAENESGNAELLFYYAGHGFPDNEKKSCLIPVDINGSHVNEGIRLIDLYKKLTQHPSKRVIVFLDACFTGGARNKGLQKARDLEVVPADDLLSGNIFVFAATSEKQRSMIYKEKGHGMFTYFVLKKLRETEGFITYNSLINYVIENVKNQVVSNYEMDQIPEINISSDIKDKWGKWKINEDN